MRDSDMISKRNKKERILEAAHTLLRETGTLKMRELAEAAGVAPMTPYNVCGSKNDVLAEISRARIENTMATLSEEGFADGLGFIFAALDRALSDFENDPDFFKALYTEAYRGGDVVLLDMFQTPRIRFWNAALLRCKDDGIFESGMLNENMTQALMYIFSGAVSRWIGDQIDAQQMFAEVNVLFLSLLLPHAESNWRAALESRIALWSDRLPGPAADRLQNSTAPN